MVGINYDDPKSIRDKMLKLVYEEGKEQPDQQMMDALKLEIFGDYSKIPLEFEAYRTYLVPLLAEKQREIDNSEFAEIVKKYQDAQFEEQGDSKGEKSSESKPQQTP